MKLKIITCILALAAECLCQNICVPPSEFQLDEQFQKTLTRMVSISLLNGYKQQVLSNQYNTVTDGAETRATLFPPQPDPLPLDDLSYSFEELGLPDILAGSVNYTEVVVTGTSTLVHDISAEIALPVKITFTLNAPKITLKGVHDTDLSFLSGLYNLTGQDNFELNVVNLATKVEVSVFVSLATDRVSITNFALTLEYEDFSIDFGVTEVNGVPLIWEHITTQINNCFEEHWESVNDAITQLVMNDINELLKDCSITELASGNLQCLFPAVPIPSPSTTAATTEGIIESTTPADNGVSKMVQISSLFLVLPLTYIFV